MAVKYLKKTLGFLVVGEAGRYADALMIASREQPDIILLDLTMVSDNGFSIIPRILEAASAARLIILTESLDPQDHRAAIGLGAKGLVLKQEPSEALINAINKVKTGGISLEPLITEMMINDLFAAPQSKSDSPETNRSVMLTPRERQVVSLVAEGLKNKEIARNLRITEATVSHHLTSIFKKLGVPGRLQLVIHAHRKEINNIEPRRANDGPIRN